MIGPAGDLQVGIVWNGDIRQVQLLEARPVDSLWVGGHVSSRNPSPEAMVGLTRLATMTERVIVGSSILLLPLYPPALVAKQIADLDRTTQGRIVLGVGVGGEYPQEFRALEIPVKERGRRANEMIPLLRRLWSGAEISHEGTYYSFKDVKIHPAPVQPGGPPIVVAGRKVAAMRRAATLGDGWLPYMYSPRRYAESVRTITEVADEVGRNLVGFGWYVWIFLNINPDGIEARKEVARAMGGTYDQDFRPMVDRVAAAGTASEVTSTLCQFYDAGARHFIFLPATDGGDERMVLDRLFADVLPPLREHATRVDASK
jgi:alkanesulfonate monooxygenase SsuD/methylene tetrahydromethanopterin reductase-like flavin-dependent oxidoreductase (luciferase family)